MLARGGGPGKGESGSRLVGTPVMSALSAKFRLIL